MQGRDAGLWARVGNGEHKDGRTATSAFDSFASRFETGYFGIEGGIDVTLVSDSDWNLVVGAMGGSVDAETQGTSTPLGFGGSTASTIDGKVKHLGAYAVLSRGPLTIDAEYRKEWSDLSISAQATAG